MSVRLSVRTAAARNVVTCPECHALAGTPCQGDFGPLPGAHYARVRIVDLLAMKSEPTTIACPGIHGAPAGDNQTHHIVRDKCRTCGIPAAQLRYEALYERNDK